MSLSPTTPLIHGQISQWIADLERLHDTLPAMEETSRWRADIANLVTQLRGQTRYAAVFGAFSAGKSSLINALLGEPLLAVSPNPTTAAITHLVPGIDVTSVNRVTAKTETQLWDDVQASFVRLHIPVDDLDAAITQAGGLQVSQFPATLRRSVSFVKAVADGFDDMRPRLGTTWEVDDQAVRRATAEERHACFVQQVDITVPTPVFGEGVVVVDTPGVDSIHRRHTDVAFDYMRRADIVIFVLYYTHAFSRADKEFVQQLAGVQDVIGMNKLFVVVNAIDLAKSNEEREAVRTRVVGELRQLGIRQPRVYEVSSQLAMAAAQLSHAPENERFTALVRQRLRLASDAPLPDWTDLDREAGVSTLRNDVTQFLSEQSVQLAGHTVRRLQHRLRDDIQSVINHAERVRQQDAQQMADYVVRLDDYRRQVENTLIQVRDGVTALDQALVSDWSELCFHASERVRFRFGSLFREAFHPGRFREGTDTSQGLADAATDLFSALSRQLEVEARTFALRAHQQSKTVLHRSGDNLRNACLELGIVWDEQPGTFSESDTSVSADALRASLDQGAIRPAMRHFSSARQFFEGGGQQTMLQAVETLLMPIIRAELERLTAIVVHSTLTELRRARELQLKGILDRLDSTSVDENANLQQDIVALTQTRALLADA